MEVAAFALTAEQDYDSGGEHHDCGDARERCCVAEALSQ